MRKLIGYIIIFTAIFGCVDINDEIVEKNRVYYIVPFELKVGTHTTRSFDANLKWSWEIYDKVYGYQVAGNNIVNALTLIEDNLFSTDNFIYASQDKATFHFVYPGCAELDIAFDGNRGIKQKSIQSGKWEPVLVGSTVNKIYTEVMGGEMTVQMEHLSSALEIRVWNEGVTEWNVTDSDRKNIVKAELISTDNSLLLDYEPGYNNDGTITYTAINENIGDDKICVKVENINSPVVVFNVAPHPEKYNPGTLKLVLKDEHNQVCRVDLPSISFGAGERSVVNIVWKASLTATLPDGPTFRNQVATYIREQGNITKIKFIANSNTTSSHTFEGTNIYLVKNADTLELHTSSEEFVANENCKGMFAGLYGTFNELEYITSIDFGENFNTSNVTNMNEMFRYACNLKELDLSTFDTKNVTTMSCMFKSCKGLSKLDISNFLTTNVEYMDEMFCGCENITNLDLSSFDTQNVTNMGMMFYDCNKLPFLDLKNFNTKKVTNMHFMFGLCSSLDSLNIVNFDTQMVLTMISMFHSCEKMSFLDLTSFIFNDGCDVETIFALLGVGAENKPIPIYVTADAKKYLEGQYIYLDSNDAKLVVRDENNVSVNTYRFNSYTYE